MDRSARLDRCLAGTLGLLCRVGRRALFHGFTRPLPCRERVADPRGRVCRGGALGQERAGIGAVTPAVFTDEGMARARSRVAAPPSCSTQVPRCRSACSRTTSCTWPNQAVTERWPRARAGRFFAPGSRFSSRLASWSYVPLADRPALRQRSPPRPECLPGSARARTERRRGHARFRAAALFVGPSPPQSRRCSVPGSGCIDATAGLLFVVAWGNERPLWQRTVLALAALLVGIGSKETAVVFPALALAVWFSSPRLPNREGLALAVVTGCAAGIYAMWRLTGPGVVQGYAQPLARRLVKEMVVRTFDTLAVPWHRDLGPVAIVLGAGAGVLLPLLLVLNVRVWRKDRAAFGRAIRLTAWILLSTAPVYGLLFVSPELGGSRYLYLAEAGWSILLAEMLVGGMRSITRNRALIVAPPRVRTRVRWRPTSDRHRHLERRPRSGGSVTIGTTPRPSRDGARATCRRTVRQMQALGCQRARAC